MPQIQGGNQPGNEKSMLQVEKSAWTLVKRKTFNHFFFHFTNIRDDTHFYFRCYFVLTAIFRRLSLYITNSPDKEAVQLFPSKVDILGSVMAEQTLFAIFLSSSKRNICRKNKLRKIKRFNTFYQIIYVNNTVIDNYARAKEACFFAPT